MISLDLGLCVQATLTTRRFGRRFLDRCAPYRQGMHVERLGLFGGTFDPPHNGHVAAVKAARDTGFFDRIIVTVANDPYNKSIGRSISPAPVRLAMAHVAFDDLHGVEVSDQEICRGGTTFTIDTVRELLTDANSVELLVGADAANSLASWHQSDELCGLVRVGIFPRGPERIEVDSRWSWRVIPMEPVDLSSTYVRDQLDLGHEFDHLIPSGVISLFRSAHR